MSIAHEFAVNGRLRTVLQESGLTHDVVARAVNRIAAEHGVSLRANKSLVTHWINGTRPRPQTINFLCEALSRHAGRRIEPREIGYGDVPSAIVDLSGDPVDAVARLGTADVHRRHILASAIYSVGALLLPVEYVAEAIDRQERATGGRIGKTEVEAVRDITAAFNRADEKLGGGFGRTAVVEYLTTDVATYCNANASDPIRKMMLSASADLAYLAGWKAHDIGREGLAQHYYLRAYQLAVESGDLGQAAYVMRILAHQAYDLGHHANCTDLASAAVRLSRGRADTHTQALFHLTLARAHAMNRDHRMAVATIGTAEALMSKARLGEDRPPWATIHGLGPAQFNNHVAKILASLGDYQGAAEHFGRSLDLYLDRTTMPRIYALASSWLAETQCLQGHVEQACATWADAQELMNGIQSSRTADSQKTMKSMLSPYKARGIPAVTRLLQTA